MVIISSQVIDKRKYERNVNVGEVTFSIMNLLSVKPLVSQNRIII